MVTDPKPHVPLTTEDRASIRAEAEAMLRMRNEANGLTRVALRMLADLDHKDAEIERLNAELTDCNLRLLKRIEMQMPLVVERDSARYLRAGWRRKVEKYQTETDKLYSAALARTARERDEARRERDALQSVFDEVLLEQNIGNERIAKLEAVVLLFRKWRLANHREWDHREGCVPCDAFRELERLGQLAALDGEATKG